MTSVDVKKVFEVIPLLGVDSNKRKQGLEQTLTHQRAEQREEHVGEPMTECYSALKGNKILFLKKILFGGAPGWPHQ